MILNNFLLHKRADILKKWLRLIMETYPGQTSKFMRGEKDPFVNPVGYTTGKEAEAIYDGLVQEIDIDQLSGSLDKIIQIRSVQDFSPSKAVAILLLLKKAIYEEMERNGTENMPLREWLDLESRIDQMTLAAFDIYTKYRERVYEVRMNEIKKERDRTLKLLERTGSTEKHRDPETSSG